MEQSETDKFTIVLRGARSWLRAMHNTAGNHTVSRHAPWGHQKVLCRLHSVTHT